MTNNDFMLLNVKKTGLQLFLFTTILFLLHLFINKKYFFSIEFYFDLWKIYAFHFITVATVILILTRQSIIKPKSTFYIFIVLSVLKMLAALLFLSPLFYNKELKPIPSVFSFFIPYFSFLIFESVIAVRVLNPKK